MSSGGDSSLTASLGAFARDLRFEDIPAEGVQRAKASILDAIGCALAGSTTEEAVPVRHMVLADGGMPVARLFGTTHRLPPAAAALANATAGHALDYDDSSPPMIGHPSITLASSTFALADRDHRSGRDVIAAYVAGLDVGARLGRHLNPSHYAAGWHATATLGTLASATACAKLIGLDQKGIRTAVGIAASSASGIRKNFGSMVKPLHAGFAARNGVIAALLAGYGHTADLDALDGERGFIDVFGGATRPDMNGVQFGLAQPLEIIRSGVGIKRYACCGCTHSALDALLAIRNKHHPDPARVKSIDITMNALVPDILVHHNPTSPAQAKFSMEYCLAVALLDGDCGIAQFSEERVAEPAVRALTARVTPRVDDGIVYRNGVYPGTVTLHMDDGQILSQRAEEALGHPDFPLSLPDLRAKFLSCATLCMTQPRAEQAFESLANLEMADDLHQLTELLTA